MKMTRPMLVCVVLMMVTLCAVGGAPMGDKPPVCGNNTLCCRVDKENVTRCKNIPSEKGQGILACPWPWSCICEEGYVLDPYVEDSETCVPEVPGCPEITEQCPYIQQVVCDGTNYSFSGSYQYVVEDLASLRYSITYYGNRNIVVSTCNAADYDTQLAIFDCAALAYVEPAANGTCGIAEEYSLYDNDDGRGCGLTSLLQIPEGELASGTYIIGVFGYRSKEGNFIVTISC
ncbi:uncharacterized protein LOC106172231 [Lingula anatina]|uniref:Uncharacterized protein LOC106172231 n=1 Tax=Lingula anatina TaxID=7574 RepID=A0A1S3JD34_LINAN|nr:uncharacterized protein LOC106172231 [Lingula anatina]|eukprot:XP_013408317.1 uncharacterized protein LOC106172231 [Lingula anatina]